MVRSLQVKISLSRIKEVVLNNLSLKLLALLLSLSLWFLVINQTAVERVYNVKINLTNLPKGVIAKPDLDSIKIKVKGRERDLEEMSAEDFSYCADLGNIATDKDVFLVLDKKNVRASIRVKVLDLSPDRLLLRLKKR